MFYLNKFPQQNIEVDIVTNLFSSEENEASRADIPMQSTLTLTSSCQLKRRNASHDKNRKAHKWHEHMER